MSEPPRTPAERFATLLLCLTQAVAARSGWDRMISPLIGLITDRLREIKQHFARFADSARDGRPFARRRTARPRPKTARGPRPPSKLPRTAGWLWALMPEAVQFRSQLEFLLQDAAMMALLAAAPVSTIRALRSLCWALRLPPPPILALPKPAAPPAASLATSEPSPPTPRPRRPPRPRPAPPPARAASAQKQRPAGPRAPPHPV